MRYLRLTSLFFTTYRSDVNKNSKMDLLAAKVVELMAEKEATLRRHQDMCLRAKHTQHTANQDAKITEWFPGFIHAVAEHIYDVEGIIMVLTALCTEKPDPSTLPSLVEDIMKAKEKGAEVNSWALKFDCMPESSSNTDSSTRKTEAGKSEHRGEFPSF